MYTQTLERRSIRLDDALSVAAYADSREEWNASDTDYWRALAALTLARPDVATALESVRTVRSLLLLAKHTRYANQARATAVEHGEYCDAVCLFPLAPKEVALLAKRLPMDVHSFPVRSVDHYRTTDGAALVPTIDKTPDANGAPTLRLTRGADSWNVRADYYGWFVRRYPGCTWHAKDTDEYVPLSIVVDGDAVGLLMSCSKGD